MSLNRQQREYLGNKAFGFGVHLSNEHIDLLSLYITLLLEWNNKTNIIGFTDMDRILNELILDSIVAVPSIPGKGILADLGSGAGLPGIIIKILRPSLSMNLIDSNRKKCSFLKQVIRELKFSDIDVLNVRVEDVRNRFQNRCDVITSRAMTSLCNIIELCAGFLNDNGKIIGFSGSNTDEELSKSQGAMQSNSLVIEGSIEYKLPARQGQRTIIILKTKKTKNINSRIMVG